MILGRKRNVGIDRFFSKFSTLGTVTSRLAATCF